MAAHITVASVGGPRYDAQLANDDRKSAGNGIWLCQNCAKLVDNDEDAYTVDILQRWKTISESAALRALESRNSAQDPELLFLRLEKLLPDLLDQMRKDLLVRPLGREFVVLSKSWGYNAGGPYLAYYYEQVPDLDDKLRILQNYLLIQEITFNNVKRYVIMEALARYFGA